MHSKSVCAVVTRTAEFGPRVWEKPVGEVKDSFTLTMYRPPSLSSSAASTSQPLLSQERTRGHSKQSGQLWLTVGLSSPCPVLHAPHPTALSATENPSPSPACPSRRHNILKPKCCARQLSYKTAQGNPGKRSLDKYVFLCCFQDTTQAPFEVSALACAPPVLKELGYPKPWWLF